jgi:hypothetical protein
VGGRGKPDTANLAKLQSMTPTIFCVLNKIMTMNGKIIM